MKKMNKILLTIITLLALLFNAYLSFGYSVKASVYHAVASQCDNRPFETASGKIINPKKATSLHWIAVSRNLHKRWGGFLKFGDTVIIKGTSNPCIDGEYIVNDIMNKRFQDKIDILVTQNSKIFNCWNNISFNKKQPNNKSFKNSLNNTLLNNFVEKFLIKSFVQDSFIPVNKLINIKTILIKKSSYSEKEFINHIELNIWKNI